MGYYTYFNLRVTETPHLFNGKSITNESELEIAQKLYSIISYGDVLPKVPDYDTPLEYVFDDAMKWYDYEQDMKELSKQYPEFYFWLRGDGEESDDLWVACFHNGKSRTLHINIDKLFIDLESKVVEDDWE